MGDLSEAEALCSKALSAESTNTHALHLLGVIRYLSGDYQAAEQSIARAIANDPTKPSFHFNRALSLAALGKPADARRSYELALRWDPSFVPDVKELASNLRRGGRFEQALTLYEDACRLDISNASLHVDRGVVLSAMGRLDEAVSAWKQANVLDSSLAAPLMNLGVASFAQGRFADAELYFRQALVRNSRSADAHSNLGHTLRFRNQTEAAFVHLRTAIDLDRRSVPAWINLGSLLAEMEEPDKALICYEEVLRMTPSDPLTRYNRACILLKLARFPEAWSEFEWRFALPGIATGRIPSIPVWRGEPVVGRSILITAEGGFGDAIQFFRYVQDVIQLGARVTVACPQPLLRLFRESTAAPVVEENGKHGDYDFQSTMMSLPFAFGTRLDTVPNVIPYIATQESRRVAWRERLGTESRIKVGMVWAGGFRRHNNPAHRMDGWRSIPFSVMSTLLTQSAVQFYSLQKGEPAEQAREAVAEGQLVDWTSEMVDFADSAALVCNLDLIITVDTSVAHLAGALGKRVWMLSRYNGCWRWLKDGDSSPWYPTMKLFRQPASLDWNEVVGSVSEALQAFVESTGNSN